MDNGNEIGQPLTVSSNGSIKLILSNLSVGTYTVTLDYAGDTNHPDVNTAPFTLVVNHATTKTALKVTGSSLVAGQQNASLTATVTSPTEGKSLLSGTVTFYDGSTNHAVSSAVALVNGVATFPLDLTIPPLGTHSYFAVYSGDVNAGNSTSASDKVTVKQDTAKIVLAPVAGPVSHSTPINLTATVSVVSPGAVTPTGTVIFNEDSTPIGTITLASGVAVLPGITLLAGKHKITPVYSGDTLSLGVTSTALSLTVV